MSDAPRTPESDLHPRETVVDCGLGTPDRLERLWAPYRMQYIAKGAQDAHTEDEGAQTLDDAASADGSAARPAAPKKPSNPFVTVPQLSDEEGLIVARGQHVYCVLNLYPYNPGHLLVIPYREVADLEALTPEESIELMQFAQKAVAVVKRVSSPHAFNVGFNLGRASGGSIAEHLHMHIVPRWTGDANFMTVIDGVKVLPQALQDTRRLLAQAWEAFDEASNQDGGSC